MTALPMVWTGWEMVEADLPGRANATGRCKYHRSLALIGVNLSGLILNRLPADNGCLYCQKEQGEGVLTGARVVQLAPDMFRTWNKSCACGALTFLLQYCIPPLRQVLQLPRLYFQWCGWFCQHCNATFEKMSNAESGPDSLSIYRELTGNSTMPLFV